MAVAPDFLAQAQPKAGCASCTGCGLVFLGIFLAIVALNIFLALRVSRDARARGMDNPPFWMILLLFTGLIGLLIYFFSRPQGVLIVCPKCKGKRLQTSAKCPHCGAP